MREPPGEWTTSHPCFAESPDRAPAVSLTRGSRTSVDASQRGAGRPPSIRQLAPVTLEVRSEAGIVISVATLLRCGEPAGPPVPPDHRKCAPPGCSPLGSGSPGRSPPDSGPPNPSSPDSSTPNPGAGYTTVFGSVYASITQRPPTRPLPLTDPDLPPKGRCDSQRLVEALMLTQPTRARSAKARPRSRAAVNTAAVKPNGEALVRSNAARAEPTSRTGTTGPNVSSRAIAISGVTASSTVGAAYSRVGKRAARRPPQQTRAPRA